MGFDVLGDVVFDGPFEEVELSDGGVELVSLFVGDPYFAFSFAVEWVEPFFGEGVKVFLV